MPDPSVSQVLSEHALACNLRNLGRLFRPVFTPETEEKPAYYDFECPICKKVFGPFPIVQVNGKHLLIW